MNNLQKIAGVLSIFQALIYISAFVFFGAFWNYPVDANSVKKFAYLADNQIALSIVNFIMYVLFGIFLAILVVAIHTRLKCITPTLSKIAALFGAIWVGLVIASGMIANIGLSAVLALAINDPKQAMTVWHSVYIIVEGLGGGNEVVGGLWVLILSCAALKGNELSKWLNYLGIFVGVVGIFTVYPADELTELFGVSQIIWFFCLGITLLKSNNSTPLLKQ